MQTPTSCNLYGNLVLSPQTFSLLVLHFILVSTRVTKFYSFTLQKTRETQGNYVNVYKRYVVFAVSVDDRFYFNIFVKMERVLRNLKLIAR